MATLTQTALPPEGPPAGTITRKMRRISNPRPDDTVPHFTPPWLPVPMREPWQDGWAIDATTLASMTSADYQAWQAFMVEGR